MRRRFLVFVALCASCFAQGGGQVTVGNFGAGGVVISTVANLPSGQKTGTLAVVTNGSTTSDCTTGGGANLVLCVFSGATWGPFSGSAGGGTVTSVATGAGLTGGPITSSGTLSIAAGAVTNAMLANQSVSITGTVGGGLTGGGSVNLGGSTTIGLLTSCSSGQVLQWNGSAWACSSNGTGTVTGATSSGGLLLTGTTLGLITSCSTNQVLQWSGSAWLCGTNGTVTGATSGGGLTLTSTTLGLLTSCSNGQTLQWNGTSWACASPSGSGTVNSGTATQVAYYSGSGTTVSGDSNLTDNGTNLTYAPTSGIIASALKSPSATAPILLTSPVALVACTPVASTSLLTVSTDGNFYVSNNGGSCFEIATTSGTLTNGHGVQINSTGNLVDCGSALCGAATPSFTNITSGTNTTAAMICGTGCSVTVSGSGTINGTSINGITYPASQTAGGLLYASTSSSVAATGVLPTGDFVLGGGAGGAPTATFSIVPTAIGGTGQNLGSSTGVLTISSGTVSATTPVSATYGGTGQNSSSSTGVAQVSSGTWSFSTALANGTTATTQTLGDNTTKAATDAFVLANAVTNPCTVLGGILYENGSSSLSCLTGPTSPTGVPNILTSTNSGGVAQAPAWGPPGVSVDAQSTGSYSLAVTDRGEALITTNSTTSTAVAVASPASAGFGQSFPWVWLNTGSVVGTATPTSSTVNGNATLKEVGAIAGHNPEAAFWYTDNTNWYAAEILPTDANGRLGCEGLMALTGDVTNSAGSCATTVGQVNGATVPASATLLASNSSRQLTAAALTSANVYVGNGSNLPVGVAISGDSSMTNAGVMTNTGINGATIPASAFFVGSNGSSQLIADQPFVINSQTTTYNTVAADWAGCKTISTPSGTFTVNLLASAPASGQCVNITNYGTGTITVGRNGLTINGAASNLTISAGSASAPLGLIVWSNGTNYIAQPYGGGGGGGGVSSFTGDGTILSNSASTGAVTATLVNAGAGTVLGNNGGSAAAPSYISTPVLGVSGTAGTLSMFPASGNFKTILASAATATNTVKFFAAVPTNNDTFYCAVSSTTCTLTDSGYAYNAIPAADIASGALANGMTATTQSAGDSSSDLATDSFVSTAITNAIAAVNPAVAVLAASTANLTGTYVQVGGGVGDTFTITATGAFTLDGIAINTIGQRVLLKNQSTASQNGIYTATVVGTTGVSAVFTRALDYDTPSDVNNTGSIPVQSGTVNATTSWLLTSQVTSIGSSGSSLTYAQFTVSPSTLVTSAASLTSTAFMTGAGGQGSQTPSATATLSSGGAPSFPGLGTFSSAGAASTPGLTVTGAPYTGGSATTNFPQLYVNDGTGPTTFSTAGTEFGINTPSGFTGNLLDAHINGGASAFIVTYQGLAAFGTSAPVPTVGTGGGNIAVCGTAFTGISGDGGWYCNASDFVDLMSQTTDLGSAVAESSVLTANVIPKAAGTNPQLSASSISDNATKVSTSEFIKTGNTQQLTADSAGITATTAATGTVVFTWGALPVSTNYSFHCSGTYTQATAAGGVSIAVQGATNAPTKLDAWATLYSTNPASTTVTATQAGTYALASTTATLVAAVTPGASATQYQWAMDGAIQVGASASTLNIIFFSGSASDSVVIKEGSFCTLMP